MKADYVHKDSKTINDETISYKITMPLINNEEIQRIDNHYNELVDEFTQQFVKEKDMIVAQRIMMNLGKENQQLKKQLEKKYEKVGTLTAEILYEENTRLANEITVLKIENQKLNEQLKIKHNGFMASVEESCELAEENQKLKEKIKKIVEYAYGTDMLVIEYEQLCKIAEVE